MIVKYHWSVRYAFAVAAVGISFLFRLWIVVLAGGELPTYITFYPAVMLTALVAGWGPGLLATATAALIADYWLLPPVGRFVIKDFNAAVSLALFMSMGIFMSLVAGLYRRTRDRMESLVVERTEELLKANEQLNQKIIERKQAEKELAQQMEEVQRHAAELDAIFQVLPYFVSVIAKDGRYLRVNPAMVNFFGFDFTKTTREEIAGRVQARFPHGQRITQEMLFSRALNGETVSEVEYMITNERGEERVLLGNAVPLKLGDEVYGAVVAHIDITERKQAQEALLQAHEELEERVHQRTKELKEAIMAIETEGNRFKELSETLEQRVMDRTAEIHAANEALHASRVAALNLMEDALAARKQAEEASEDLRREITSRMRAEEELLSTNESLRASRVAALNLMEDILAARKQAEKAEEHLRLHTQNSPTAIVERDADFNVTRWSGEAEHIFGWSAAETLGKKIVDLHMIYTEDIPLVEQIMGKLTDGVSQKVVSVNRNYTKDGRVIHCEWYTSVLYDADGKMTSVMSQVLDVTERKKAEEALKSSEEQYRLLSDTMHQGVVYQDNDGKILFMNPAAVRILGKTPDDFLGQTSVSVEHHTLKADGSPFPGLEHPAMVALRTGHEMRGVVMGVFNPRENGYRWVRIDAMPLTRKGESRPYQVYTVFADITEQKLAEEALRDSKAMLETVIQSMNDAVFISDAEGNFIDFNEAFATYHRFRNKEECYKSLAEYPDYINVYLADGTPAPLDMWAVPRALRGETASNDEYMLRRKDTGETWWGSYSFAPIRDNDGKIIGSVVVGRDITGSKLAEFTLQTTMQRFFVILSNMYSAILLVTDEGRVEFANQSFCDRFGLSDAPADLVWLDNLAMLEKIRNAYLHPDEAIARIREIVDLGQPVKGEELAMRNGETYLRDYVPLSIKGMSYGRLWIHVDITDRKKGEEALRRSEELYRTLFDTMLEGFCIIEMVFDAEGRPIDYRFLETNPAFEMQTGLHGAQGKLMRSLAPDQEEHWFEIYGKIALTGEPMRFENEAKALNRWFDVSAVRLGGPESRKVAILFNDITERKKMEEEVFNLLAELERSNKDLEQFAYVASHDLQEPLRMVSSYTQLLARRYKEKLDQDANDYIEYAVNGANRMQRLIKDLLFYSRITTRGASPVPVDMKAVLDEALDNLQIAIREAGAVVTNDDLPTVMADHTQLVQVLQNLIGNAVKFHGEKPPHIRISAVKDGPDWKISVQDNGIGIEPQYFERIFIIFQRLHPADRYQGTGIGLALCKRIVQRLGGNMWVESEPGKGSTFYFTLKGVE